MRSDNLFHFNDKKIYVKETPNGQETFDLIKWLEVCSAKKSNGTLPDKSNRIEGHQLIGMRLKQKSNGRVGVIEKVSEHWLIGRYLGILVNFNGSHAFMFWNNIDCENSETLSKINDTHDKYELIS